MKQSKKHLFHRCFLLPLVGNRTYLTVWVKISNVVKNCKLLNYKKMKRIKVIKLGTFCKDKATELSGMLTHWIYNMEGNVSYLFQPKGLDEEGQPVNKLYLEASRLNVTENDFEEVEVPIEILGTNVTDKASGFTGMATSFLRHINGCFHVFIQPKGMNQKNNSPIQKCDFDLRSCEGEMITKMSEKELEESKLTTPSPAGIKSDENDQREKFSYQ